jgi:release factor glutamine methyltransferase
MIRPVQAALDRAATALAHAGIDNPRLEARLLLAHTLGVTQEALLRDRAAPVDTAPLVPLLRRRQAGEPLAFLLGRREFWGLPLAVSPATLVPRPDSETLIEAAIAALPDRAQVRTALDLGTGTGCLLLAALHEFPAALGVGVDLAEGAAALARRNAAMLGMHERTAFVCADWASALAVGRFDLVLVNPPYIPTAVIAGLAPEVARYEPRSALDGGRDGFSAFRRILPALPGLLSPTGVAILELGAGQAGRVAALGRESGLDPVAVRADLNGVTRAVVLRRPAR